MNSTTIRQENSSINNGGARSFIKKALSPSIDTTNGATLNAQTGKMHNPSNSYHNKPASPVSPVSSRSNRNGTQIGGQTYMTSNNSKNANRYNRAKVPTPKAQPPA